MPPPARSFEAEIAALYVRGWTIPKIATKLEISESAVRVSIERVHERWQARADQAYDRLIAHEVAKLDAVEQAAWEGWERSTRDELQTATKDVDGPDGTRNEMSVKRTTKAGTPSFLNTIASTIRQRCELLGLVDPESEKGKTGEDAEIVPVVIESRAEAESIRTLSLSEFKAAVTKSQKARK
jgi:hypothetical protein